MEQEKTGQREEEEWGKGVYSMHIDTVRESLFSQLLVLKELLPTTNSLFVTIRGFNENLFYSNEIIYRMCLA